MVDMEPVHDMILLGLRPKSSCFMRPGGLGSPVQRACSPGSSEPYEESASCRTGTASSPQLLAVPVYSVSAHLMAATEKEEAFFHTATIRKKTVTCNIQIYFLAVIFVLGH